MIFLRRILSPMDFSAGSRRATEYAGFLARRLGAELHLLHAVLVGQERTADGDEAVSVEQLLARQAESLQSELGAPAIELRQVARRGYSAGVVILEYAAEMEAELIVLGTHGRRGAQRLLLGSVAEEVVRYANCPVLTVREAVAT
jgi:nucleotide-binding universal stress UspA family protein